MALAERAGNSSIVVVADGCRRRPAVRPPVDPGPERDISSPPVDPGPERDISSLGAKWGRWPEILPSSSSSMAVAAVPPYK